MHRLIHLLPLLGRVNKLTQLPVTALQCQHQYCHCPRRHVATHVNDGLFDRNRVTCCWLLLFGELQGGRSEAGRAAPPSSSARPGPRPVGAAGSSLWAAAWHARHTRRRCCSLAASLAAEAEPIAQTHRRTNAHSFAAGAARHTNKQPDKQTAAAAIVGFCLVVAGESVPPLQLFCGRKELLPPLAELAPLLLLLLLLLPQRDLVVLPQYRRRRGARKLFNLFIKPTKLPGQTRS